MRADAVIVIAAVGALSAAMVAPDGAGPLALAALAGLLGLAIWRRALAAAHASLFALLWTATAALAPASRVWPTKLLAPLVAYFLLVRIVPALWRSMSWLRGGKLTAGEWRWIAATVAVSSVALFAWGSLAEPNLSRHLANIPDIPLWGYPLAAILFATFNAAIEEAAFRGIVMGALDETLGAGAWVIAIQALCFGAAHFLQGFPNGWLGFAMTTIYGAMLGGIRRRSGGLLAPWIAHVAADLTIFTLLAA